MSESHSVEQIFAKLGERFRSDQASDLNAVYQFALSDAQPFFLEIAAQELSACWGEHQDPDITLHLNEQVLSDVVTGEIDGMSAFLTGKLRAEGNLMLATHLGKLFKR